MILKLRKQFAAMINPEVDGKKGVEATEVISAHKAVIRAKKAFLVDIVVLVVVVVIVGG